jgi:hypothetical protein
MNRRYLVIQDVLPESEGLKYPHAYDNDNHEVENRLDAPGHGNVSINEPQDNSGYDQRQYDIYKRHNSIPFLAVAAARL